MTSKLLINATAYEVRIALIENGNLAEYYLEHPAERGIVGNIYRGKVVRVLSGMQAAFVDIGLEKNGFLYVDDVHINSVELEKRLAGTEQGERATSCCGDSDTAPDRRCPGNNIEELLVEGQDVVVQVCKDPMGTKGARLTTSLTLPCRNLVFMPMTEHIGVSRKIADEEVRAHLKEKIEALRPAGTGFIVRTIGETASDGDLEADMEFLLHTWEEIKDSDKPGKPVPALLYEDLDITLRIVRDVFTSEVEELLVDNPQVFKRVTGFVSNLVPELRERVKLWEEDSPLFDSFGVELELNRALERKIWLRCGGYIIIEPTEALTVIDVNTGRYIGKKGLGLEETIFKTNMEAAKEIAYQIRLRNIGGIIIVDFIDMEELEHREAVVNALKEAVKKDKSKLNILQVTEFGLVQMTRKRSRDDLEHQLCDPCLCCQGTGVIRSARSLSYEIFRAIERQAAKEESNTLTVRVPPRVADLLLREETHTIDYLEKKCDKRILVVSLKEFHPDRYELLWH